MPIEIRELEISVSIEDQNAGAPAGGGSGNNTPKNVDDIVARCVDQVMDMLREQKEA